MTSGVIRILCDWLNNFCCFSVSCMALPLMLSMAVALVTKCVTIYCKEN